MSLLGRIWDYPNDRYCHRRVKTADFFLDVGTTKSPLKGEQAGLIPSKFPDEFSTLKALECALEYSLANNETEEARHLESLITEWSSWLSQFAGELMSRKNNFELSVSDCLKPTSSYTLTHLYTYSHIRYPVGDHGAGDNS
eukprot:Blabericola_migrator_1__7612@NODE_388_length_9090_cov_142_959769_g311_i0_p5_GENE_NODE_388_length_9090_cov_142_959769_g311_i0NODE_388_length_9090_cov_142_959769_g311_i0_p5_ORF_typecomplete_len141_score18_84_NODE_388_length_9090_cov_142_959769_g311_i017882210